jgi:hypothetical protein
MRLIPWTLRSGSKQAPCINTSREISVPDRRSRNIPEVVLVRLWAVRVLGIWRGEGWGEGWDKGVSLQAT